MGFARVVRREGDGLVGHGDEMGSWPKNIKQDANVAKRNFVPVITPQMTQARVGTVMAEISITLRALIIEGADLIRPFGKWDAFENVQKGLPVSVQKLMELFITLCHHANMPKAWPQAAAFRLATAWVPSIESECLARVLADETRAQADADVVQMQALLADSLGDAPRIELCRDMVALHAAAATIAVRVLDAKAKRARQSHRVVRRSQLVASST